MAARSVARRPAYRHSDLRQCGLAIYNAQAKDVPEKVELVLGVSGLEGGSEDAQRRFLAPIVDEPATVALATLDGLKGLQAVRMEIPYLNSYPVHRQCIRAYLISERALKLSLVHGMGRGWSARFVSLDDYRSVESRAEVLFYLAGLALNVLAFLVVWAGLPWFPWRHGRPGDPVLGTNVTVGASLLLIFAGMLLRRANVTAWILSSCLGIQPVWRLMSKGGAHGEVAAGRLSPQ